MNAPDPYSNHITIRASALTMWPDCERRAAARLFRSIVEARGFMLRTTSIHVGAPIGTAVHAGAAFGLQAKIDTGELAPLEQAIDIAMFALDEALEKDGEIEWKPREAANRDQAQQQVRRMVHVRLSPYINPTAVEDRLIVDIGDGFVLSGQRDVYGIEVKRLKPDLYIRDDTGAWKIKDCQSRSKMGPYNGV